MKVRTKMLLSLLTLPLLLIIIIIMSVRQIADLNGASANIKDNFDASVLAGQIRADVKDQEIILRNLMIFEDEDAINNELAELQLEKDNVARNIPILESYVKTEEQQEIMNHLKEINTNFVHFANQVVVYYESGKNDVAKSLLNENSETLHEELTVTIRKLTNTFDNDLKNTLIQVLNSLQTEIITFCSILAAGLMILFFISLKTIFSLTRRVASMATLMSNIANKREKLTTKIDIIANDELDEMAASFNRMTDTLEVQITKDKETTWKQTNITDITTSLTGTRDLETLGKTLLSKLVPLINSSYAVFYVKDFDSSRFKYLASYAADENCQIKKIIEPGEGLIGQAIIEKRPIELREVPTNYVRISSAIGEATPSNVYIFPILFEGEVNAVLEFASFNKCDVKNHQFLDELGSNLGIVLESVIGRIQLAKLLEESQTLMEEIQAQSEELQNQQEELRATNEELEEQTQALRQSEQKLQMQQEELAQTNAELEVKAKILEEQNIKYEEANRIVEKARLELEQKAEELALSSKYKSEFLANMSHELRTPLNSLIILSKLLADNPTHNLTAKQVEYARTIYASGNDLLILINSILDLAKIESGKTEIIPGEVSLNNLVEYVENNFKAVADNKNLEFQIQVEDGTPPTFYSDEVRIQQVLVNLLSNAFKFTSSGQVVLRIAHDTTRTKPMFAFSVKDTGIGIPNEKLDLIFEAFQQADGTTSRKFGGTGLGLSISKEIASLLGGEIQVESQEGKGSTFTFYVGSYEQTTENPSHLDEVAATVEKPKIEVITTPIQLTEQTKENSHIKRLLIIDDDLNQRNSLMELIGNLNFVINSVSSGEEAKEILKSNTFDCIILDLGLLDTNGFDLLTQIKNHEEYKSIKVFIYTGRDLTTREEMELSKHAETIIIKNEHSPERLLAELELYLTNDTDSGQKFAPVEKLENTNHNLVGKKILLVDDDVRNVYALSSVLEMAGLDVLFAENGLESLNVLKQHSDIDLVLMDIMMPEMDGYEAITRIRSNPQNKQLPIIALTAKAMKEDREKCLQIGASDYISKPVEPDQLLSLLKVWLY
ncbi:two-component system chemotaxis sensor kinase CheA [Ureibacillus xyleni]|uniref:Circadian input-output histidine kinase CikA n=1 Tax=Ureibacillus xyleni TaxID=614648 RepID=A0A285TK24_9BACL|nr:response regulator [Ureibacillus xyleni]SOC22648.1 two-component system chemotaxis sensor kinase CheA [Ureibacillus xyleni]